MIGAAASNPLVLYEQGEIDVVDVPSYALARAQDESGPLARELVSVPELSLTYLGMNVQLAPFDDPKVRQAFALLIDRARIAEVTLPGAVAPARGILPPGIPGYNPELSLPEPDAARARALIAESRGQVQALLAKASAEVDVQKARLAQVRYQLIADKVKPAEARKAQMVQQARGAVADVA